MAIDVSLDDAPALTYAGPFYAIRIGTGRDNDIVISGASAGVHEHHCTLIHTGSSYRIEMLPTHLVFIDGELAECGQQLFLENFSRCVLSIGGAPAGKGLNAFDPPPKVVCVRIGEAVDPKTSTQNGKPMYNRDRVGENRKLITSIVWCVTIALPVMLGFFALTWFQAGQDRARINQISDIASQIVSQEVANTATRSVVQLGVVSSEDGEFYPIGTGWIWAADEGNKLVTNIHVLNGVISCTQVGATCAGEEAATAAVRLHQDFDRAPIALPDLAGLASRHPDYSAFSVQLAQRGRDLGVPNIYDVAVLNLPDLGLGTDVKVGLAILETVPVAGKIVATIGFPLEGDLPAEQSAAATIREARIGRVSGPFGIPSRTRGEGEADIGFDPMTEFLVITGAPAQGGESGSPIIDGEARVVGMVFAGYFDSDIQTGTALARRQSGTVKLKALSARLLQDFSGPSEDRAPYWSEGLDRINLGYKEALLKRREIDECPNALAGQTGDPVVQRQGQLKEVVEGGVFAAQAVSFAMADEVSLSLADLDTDDTAPFVVVASSSTSPKGVVTMRAKNPVTGYPVRSADQVSSQASVSFRVNVPANRSALNLQYEVYSDQAGPVMIEVYRITCGPEG